MPTPSLHDATPLDIAATFAGKRILFVGATGFVGKVAMSMLLRRYPGLGKVYCLVRPGAGSSAEERFFRKIVASPVFDPIREVWGEGTDAFLREKVQPLAGDVSRPLLNFTPADFEQLGHIDCVINSAGLVSFNPPLETALRINTLGVKNVLDVCRKTGASLVHISTCFVAGARDGEIWEDETVLGYFPRKGDIGERSHRARVARGVVTASSESLPDEDFSVEAEIADCQRLIEQVKARADDRQHLSEFREKGSARLREDGRDADDERTLKIAVQRERKMWMHAQLTDLGMERAQHWGWPNTYTYTKSLGEQLCAAATFAPSENAAVQCCIVRPSIVESSVAYPFAGWNEGFNTTAPLAMLGLLGHRNFPAGDGVICDLVPVDMVASGVIAATAATIQKSNAFVYQLCSGDVNPFWQKRCVELVGLYKRRYFKQRTADGEGNSWINALQARLETIPGSKERFDRISAPLAHKATRGLLGLLDRITPRWGAPRAQALADRARQKLEEIESLSGQTLELFKLFMPFIHDNEYVYRADNTRALFARLTPPDQAALPWGVGTMNWREYWLDVHMVGLEKWVFPSLEEEFKVKPKSVYTYKDLLEMFDATTKHHRHRTAMRLLPPSGTGLEPVRYTYGDLSDLAARAASRLHAQGVASGDRVMLLAENRPEWGISYFGILKAGAVVVPVDHQATLDEVHNLLKWSGARAAVVSARQRERLGADELARGGVPILDFDEVLATSDTRPLPSAFQLVHQPKGDDLASLIFTSGTTGKPKGVMLSHRNFSSLLSKLAGVFDIDQHDGLLSVLPLHHTLEFTAGLLMPLMRGAQIAYMDEVSADNLSSAFEEGNVTGMIGVPALWQLLHRKITSSLAERGPLVVGAFNAIVEAHRRMRDALPANLNLGRLLFWPVHKRFGGRLRLLISGGSALPPDTMKAFRGLGFSLYEGYGLTEASPVLTVNRPGQKVIAGSVGEALPGVEVKIFEPDASGVGEIIASGPNVMSGYYENAEATAGTLHNGWLHTGDLGKFDDEGRLFIVGRKKDVIIGASGENVYPDELEDVYRDSPYVKELSIVGLPDTEGGELVACLAVPEYEQKGDRADYSREEIRERLREHVRATSSKLPHYKRVKVLHITEIELPKTATRKVKRKLVVEELQKLERARHKGQEVAAQSSTEAAPHAWLSEILATVSGKALDKVRAAARLDELGFDSLMYTELGVALEAAGVAVPDGVDLTGVASIADFEKLVASWGRRKDGGKALKRDVKKKDEHEADEIPVPGAVVTIGNALLDFGQRMTYERLFTTKVTGAPSIPRDVNFIVAANHASHLDMGLVKHALGDWGPNLVALAAKDYFFEDPIKRAYFENFTNLVPMDRHGSLRESLRLATDVLRQGYVLLIFPEGTRSTTGVMTDFKPSVGYLALANGIGILPMYLDGTYDAMPKGSLLPQKRNIAARIGRYLSPEDLAKICEGHPKGEHNRVVAQHVEAEVRAMAPRGSVNWRARSANVLMHKGTEVPTAPSASTSTHKHPHGDVS